MSKKRKLQQEVSAHDPLRQEYEHQAKMLRSWESPSNVDDPFYLASGHRVPGQVCFRWFAHYMGIEDRIVSVGEHPVQLVIEHDVKDDGAHFDIAVHGIADGSELITLLEHYLKLFDTEKRALELLMDEADLREREGLLPVSRLGKYAHLFGSPPPAKVHPLDFVPDSLVPGHPVHSAGSVTYDIRVLEPGDVLPIHQGAATHTLVAEHLVGVKQIANDDGFDDFGLYSDSVTPYLGSFGEPSGMYGFPGRETMFCNLTLSGAFGGALEHIYFEFAMVLRLWVQLLRDFFFENGNALEGNV